MTSVKKLFELLEAVGRGSIYTDFYSDEPILRPASELNTFLAEEIKRMKKLAENSGSQYRFLERIFYKQAEFMENFTDNYENEVSFSCYYPTYRDMNDRQLRWYFTWRSKVRKGEITKTSLSYAFVYIYELLHHIGSQTAREGFDKLKQFYEEYRIYEPKIVRYMRQWIIDYVVYYDLDTSLLNEYVPEIESYIPILENCENADTDKLFDAVCAFSSYNIRKSALFKKDPQRVKDVMCKVYRHISYYYAKNRKKNLCDKLFGKKFSNTCKMFDAAVFYDRIKQKDRICTVNANLEYTCKNGSWTCKKYYGVVSKNRWLGDIMRTVDSKLRLDPSSGCKPIEPACDVKWVLAIIDEDIDEYNRECKINEARRISIDTSKLEGIRRSADITREKLLTEEEREEETPAPVIFGEMPLPLNEERSDTDCPLDEEETAFLKALLYDGHYSGKGMPSVLADSVNEKLFDMFGDIVIEFDGDMPAVIEDYADELKGIIKNEDT